MKKKLFNFAIAMFVFSSTVCAYAIINDGTTMMEPTDDSEYIIRCKCPVFLGANTCTVPHTGGLCQSGVNVSCAKGDSNCKH